MGYCVYCKTKFPQEKYLVCEECREKDIQKDEIELVEDTLLGIIMLESQPEKILTQFRVWLQERKASFCVK